MDVDKLLKEDIHLEENKSYLGFLYKSWSDGGWRTADGEWRTADGRWLVANIKEETLLNMEKKEF